MPYFCITINGQHRCFEVPLLVDKIHIRRPPPNNYPPFDLAVTVQELINVIRPLAPNSPVVKHLDEVSRAFIQEVQASLPKGVEFSYEQAAPEKAV